MYPRIHFETNDVTLCFETYDIEINGFKTKVGGMFDLIMFDNRLDYN
jgi:hypothetical protein